MQKIVAKNDNQLTKQTIQNIINNINNITDYVAKGSRNSILKYKIDSKEEITIKSFKKPNFINKFVYKFIRPSKAQRSYNYANKLVELGFKTPNPIAYVEESNNINLLKSYYISSYLDADFTFRELVDNEDWPNKKEILKQFTYFTYRLHEAGIEFLDHSPGNTLIKEVEKNKYEFYLVDLNRMNFHDNLSFEKRIENFSRLTPHQDMVYFMAEEYAKLIKKPANLVKKMMWEATDKFQTKIKEKQKLKSKLKNLLKK